MVNLIDKGRKPGFEEIEEYIGNPIFLKLHDYVTGGYNALRSMEYSGDNRLPGWNLRYYKSGRTLLRLYPQNAFFKVLYVVGKKEKEAVEELLPMLSDYVKKVYDETPEGMGQRWLILDVKSEKDICDLMKLVEIRATARQRLTEPK